MSSEHGTYGRHPAPGTWSDMPGPAALGHLEQPPAGHGQQPGQDRASQDLGGPPYAWHASHGGAAGYEAEPRALHEYLLLLGGHTAQTAPLPPAARPDNGGQLTPAEADALIAESSLGTPGVVDIAARASDQDVADVMGRLHALRQPAPEPPQAEYAFERWIDKSRDLPHTLMRVGRSYARQHFHHRADLCFRAAMAAGHPEAEAELAALPRTREGLIEAGAGPTTGPTARSGHRAGPAQTPTRAHRVCPETEATVMSHTEGPMAAQPVWALGWAADMQAI